MGPNAYKSTNAHMKYSKKSKSGRGNKKIHTMKHRKNKPENNKAVVSMD